MTIEQLLVELQQQGIDNPAVLSALKKISRENFVDDTDWMVAYENRPLPIANQQTISQPYIVAQMTTLLIENKEKLHRVLEIGTGSGYQAAILSCVVQQIDTVERIENLHQMAKKRLAHFSNIRTHLADGTYGLAEYAPYDGILVTACADKISNDWLEQLAEGGRLVLPLQKKEQQHLVRVTRCGKDFQEEIFEPVRFVPLLSGISQID